MLNIISGDITNVKSGMILQQVNCQNVMGAGVAKAIYTKWPTVKSAFHAFSNSARPFLFGQLQRPFLFGQLQVVPVTEDLCVINCFTQFDYGNSHITKKVYTDESRLIYNIKQVHAYAVSRNELLYIPKFIGCGLAGGNWDKVSKALEGLPNLVVVQLDSK